MPTKLKRFSSLLHVEIERYYHMQVMKFYTQKFKIYL